MSADSNDPLADDAPLGFMSCPTPQLRAVVEAQRAALPADDFAGLLQTIERLYDKYVDALDAAAPGVERARALHRMMDQAVATAASVPVSCRRGCAGCCHYEVEVTRDEAVVLAEKIHGGMTVDRSRLAEQAGRERLSPKWARFFHPENRCVFLGEEGACRIYEDRPAACRRLLVTSPAEMCTTAGAPVAPVRILLAEILLSAAVELADGGFASISRMLKGELDGEI